MHYEDMGSGARAPDPISDPDLTPILPLSGHVWGMYIAHMGSRAMGLGTLLDGSHWEMGYLAHGPGPQILCQSSVSRVSGPWPGTPDPMPIIGEPTDGLRGSPMLKQEWALSSRRESTTRP